MTEHDDFSNYSIAVAHLHARYQHVAADDPVEYEVARRQLTRLDRGSTDRTLFRPSPSPWRHAPLPELFGTAGNRLHSRGDGRVECGHEPFHSSKSGHCVVIDPAMGLWWCRSCRRGGDVARWVMDLHGWDRAQAEGWLIRHYGVAVGGVIGS
jgi:hypothetical protein